MVILLRAICLRLLALAALAAALVSPTAAACLPQSEAGIAYVVCRFDPATAAIAMAWRRPDHRPLATFEGLSDDLARGGRRLVFAMNGGMYRDDLSPVGLYVEDGVGMREMNTLSVAKKPEPNFYKKPNGVFYLADKTAGILTTDAYLSARPQARFATQSGPMLVIGGAIHPAFIPGSTDRKRRDGVGVTSAGEAVFAIADDPVNFDDFARFFRDTLGCPDALFLDGGSAPGLFSAGLGRSDPPGHGGYGPMILVTE